MKPAALLLFLVVALLAGFIASQFEPGTWYEHMNKPAWTPPDAVFMPVWLILYVLMGVAAWLVWERRGMTGAHGLFFVQLALNAGWSWLFFGLHRPGWAFGEILLLCLAVFATLVAFWRHRPAAGALMLPYAAWLAFAAALNYELWRLNGGGLPL